jgi:transcription antitermination factor NusG
MKTRRRRGASSCRRILGQVSRCDSEWRQPARIELWSDKRANEFECSTRQAKWLSDKPRKTANGFRVWAAHISREFRRCDSQGGSLRSGRGNEYQQEMQGVRVMDLSRGQNLWFAVQVRPKHEFIAAAILRTKGYEEFVPTYSSKRCWSDRTKIIQLPLFPGYVFCRCFGDGCPPVVTTPGVIRIITAGKEIGWITEAEIEVIRKVMRHELSALPWNQAKIGDTVRVESGPLAGTVGVLISFKNKRHLILAIDAVQRSIAVEMHDSHLVLLAKTTPCATNREPAYSLQ